MNKKGLEMLMLPIQALFHLCMDIRKMSTRHYASVEELLTKTMSSLIHKASILDEYIDHLTQDEDFKKIIQKQKINKEVNRENVEKLLIIKITEVLAIIKQLPPSVREVAILMAILLEETNLKDILPDEYMAKFDTMMQKINPYMDGVKEMVERGDMEGVQKAMDTLIDNVSNNYDDAKSVIERAKQLLKQSMENE